MDNIHSVDEIRNIVIDLLKAYGNIGIGTDAHSTIKLLVNGHIGIAANPGYYYIKNSSGKYCVILRLSTGDDTVLRDGANNDALTLYNSGIKAFSGGNLGIGTATPAKELDVNGDISLEAGSGDYYSNDGSQGWSGTFNNADGDVVTVKNGIITAVTTP